MVNKVILVGRLGKDPEDAVGNRPLTFSLATSKRWRDRQTGERREKTEWHNIVVFQKQAQEFAGQYLRKGMQIYLEGSIATRKWQDNAGTTRYATEILVNDFDHKIISVEASRGTGYQAGGSLSDYGFDEPGAHEPGAGRSGGADPYYQGDPNARPRTTMDNDFTLPDGGDEIPF